MQLGAVTYNVLKDMDLDTVIQTLEAAGFEAVELRTGHKHGVEPGISDAERQRVKTRFERSKVRLVSFGSTCEFQSPDAAERKRQIETARQFIVLAHDTGAIGVKVRPNGLAKGVPAATTVPEHCGGPARSGRAGVCARRRNLDGSARLRDAGARHGGRDHARHETPERGAVLEFESYRRGEREREGQLRAAAAMAEELPY
jgi:sugar phosphate isomerase/epimerase